MAAAVATALSLGAAAMPALATCPSEPGRFVLNGAEATDTQTGLIWARCAAGQSWDGNTCTGENPTLYTREQAFEYAASQSGWRLPSVKELLSLVDERCEGHLIDLNVFPNTKARLHWSATPNVQDRSSVFLVSFYGGIFVGQELSFGTPKQAVRLVRSNP